MVAADIWANLYGRMESCEVARHFQKLRARKHSKTVGEPSALKPGLCSAPALVCLQAQLRHCCPYSPLLFLLKPSPESPLPLALLGPSPVSDPRLTLAYTIFHQASHMYQ